MRDVYERETGKTVSMFMPIMYTTQVVAGLHYFIKVASRAIGKRHVFSVYKHATSYRW